MHRRGRAHGHQRRDPPAAADAAARAFGEFLLGPCEFVRQAIRSRTVYPMVRAALKIVGSMHSRLPPIAFHTHMGKTCSGASSGRSTMHRPMNSRTVGACHVYST